MNVAKLEVVVDCVAGQPDFFQNVIKDGSLALTLLGGVVSIRQEKQCMPLPRLVLNDKLLEATGENRPYRIGHTGFSFWLDSKRPNPERSGVTKEGRQQRCCFANEAVIRLPVAVHNRSQVRIVSMRIRE